MTVIVIVAGIFMVGGCASSSDGAGMIKNIELMEAIDIGKAPVIVDVRSSWEYEGGHIPGALHIPFWSAFFNADKIAAGSSDPVVVYCEHGPRAWIAKFALRQKGLSNIVYLDGHMAGWKKAGFVIEK